LEIDTLENDLGKIPFASWLLSGQPPSKKKTISIAKTAPDYPPPQIDTKLLEETVFQVIDEFNLNCDHSK